MGKSINKWIGIGNCCKDPDIKHARSGSAITSITVACNDSYKDKSGKLVDTTEFVRVVFFNKIAEIAGEFLRKGSKVYVEGRLKTRKYTDSNGIERYMTEIVGSEMQMLDIRNVQDNANNGPHGNNYKTEQKAPQEESAPPVMDDFDESIPF